MPTLQIHVPAYNEEGSIGPLVESVLNQTFEDFSLVIHDNASTDGTVEEVRRTAGGDPRVRLDLGSFNVGGVLNLSRCRSGDESKYIALRSANDLIHRDYFHETLALLEANPQVALAYSHGAEFQHSIQDAEPAPEALRIDTRGMSPFDSAVHVMQRYTAPFALWGVYRRPAYDACRPYQFVYGGDHVWIAEMALYGAVASIPQILDYRRRGPRDAAAGISANARSQSEEHARAITETSFFNGVKHRLPFTDMAWGHVEMFSLARIDDTLKQNLILAAREVFRTRFIQFLTHEAESFHQWLSALLATWQYGSPATQPNLYLWTLKVRREIDKIRFLQTLDTDRLAHIEKLLPV
jgi:hypothetical protein